MTGNEPMVLSGDRLAIVVGVTHSGDSLYLFGNGQVVQLAHWQNFKPAAALRGMFGEVA